MRSFLDPLKVDEDNLAFSAMQEVGPGGHFFGAQHTLSRFDSAFYEPMLSDWRNFENWSESGAKTGTERAHLIWKDLLRTYEEPALIRPWRKSSRPSWRSARRRFTHIARWLARVPEKFALPGAIDRRGSKGRLPN